MLADEAFALQAGRLLARIDNSKRKRRFLVMTETSPTLPAETGGTEITRFNALTPRRAVALHRAALGGCRRIPRPRRGARGRARTAGTDRGASGGGTGRVSCGVSGGCDWPRPLLTGAASTSTLDSYRETVKVALVHLDATDQSERVVDAIRTTAADTEEDIARHGGGRGHDRAELSICSARTRNDTYDAALAALREDTQAMVGDMLPRDPARTGGGRGARTADADGLRRFLEGEVLPWFERRQEGTGQSAADPRAGVRRGARPRQAGAARPLRGASRPETRTDARHAAASQGPAAGDGQRADPFGKMGGGYVTCEIGVVVDSASRVEAKREDCPKRSSSISIIRLSCISVIWFGEPT